MPMQQLQSPLFQATSKWRVNKRYINGLRGAGFQPLKSIRFKHANLVSLQHLSRFMQSRYRLLLIINHNDLLSPARSRLKTQGTATCKKINTGCALNTRLQPVKQCFAATITGRAQAGQVTDRQLPAPP